MASLFLPKSYEGFLWRLRQETEQGALTWLESCGRIECHLPGGTKLSIEPEQGVSFDGLREQVFSWAPLAACLVQLRLMFATGEQVLTPLSAAQFDPLRDLLQVVLLAVDKARRADFDARAATIFPPRLRDAPTADRGLEAASEPTS
jgi:hypothetical protein